MEPLRHQHHSFLEDSSMSKTSWSRSVISALALVAVTACTDGPDRATLPNVPGEPLVSAVAADPSNTAGLVLCAVGVRTPSGEYRTKKQQVHVPQEAIDPNGEVLKFGVRRWVDGSSDVAFVAACEIPNTPAALEFFRTAFGVPDSLAPSRRRSPGQPAVGAPIPSLAGTPNDAVVYDINTTQTACEPYAVAPVDGCECTAETCYGYDGDGTWDGPDPMEPEERASFTDDGTDPSYYWGGTTDPDPSYYSTGDPRFCKADVDNPHGSRWAPGRVNVHIRTQCNFPTTIFAGGALERQRCLEYVCWYSTVAWAPAYQSPPGAFLAKTAANTSCVSGFYRGRGPHWAEFPPYGRKYAETSSASRRVSC
jgi:hypothetical protein